MTPFKIVASTRKEPPGESRYEEEKECNSDAEGNAEQEWWADQVVQVMLKGKRALDTAMLEDAW